MEGNPVLRKLGLAPTDRVVIIHADDIGMCHATLPAVKELFQAGLVSSASVMVPCPWFPAAASFCREHPDLDVGVHLTVTSEWMTYRWGPLSTRDPATGLLDDDGYFFRTNAAVQARAKPSAVAAELGAQLDRALAAGIDVTHIDTHMGTVLHPRFLQAYVDLAAQHRLPLFLPRLAVAAAAATRRQALTQSEVEAVLSLVQELEVRAVPLFDYFTALPLSDAAERIERARRTFDALPPGLSLFILHPAQDTPELRAICPDWPARVADYQAFMSQELQRHVHAAGVQVIGYKVLRELVRAG
jgi:predicted glycoside hydrolase/deacetylase ChbG (UPF0249 family)